MIGAVDGDTQVSGVVRLLESLSMYPVAATNDFMLVGYTYDLAFIEVEVHLPLPLPLF